MFEGGELIKKCLLVIFLYNLVQQAKEYEQSGFTKHSLKVYWNVPSFQCDPFKMNFTTMLDRHNIIHNVDSQFWGETITILYGAGNFPEILTTENNETIYRNGGVPQEGNLTLHLELLKETIISQIPNKDYSGLAIINWEGWRPIFRQHWGSVLIYKNVSLDIERQKHPTWNDDVITKEATRRLEAAAQLFMDESLNLARLLRPKGMWGFYHYPFSYTNNGTEDCVSTEVQSENDRINWLWKDSNVFYPSVYLQSTQSLENQIKYVETTLDEVFRIKQKFKADAGIYIYVTPIYTDTKTFIPREYMSTIMKIIAGYDIEGVMLWGASVDVCTQTKCEDFYNYIDSLFG